MESVCACNDFDQVVLATGGATLSRSATGRPITQIAQVAVVVLGVGADFARRTAKRAKNCSRLGEFGWFILAYGRMEST